MMIIITIMIMIWVYPNPTNSEYIVKIGYTQSISLWDPDSPSSKLVDIPSCTRNTYRACRSLMESCGMQLPQGQPAEAALLAKAGREAKIAWYFR